MSTALTGGQRKTCGSTSYSCLLYRETKAALDEFVIFDGQSQGNWAPRFKTFTLSTPKLMCEQYVPHDYPN